MKKLFSIAAVVWAAALLSAPALAAGEETPEQPEAPGWVDPYLTHQLPGELQALVHTFEEEEGASRATLETRKAIVEAYYWKLTEAAEKNSVQAWRDFRDQLSDPKTIRALCAIHSGPARKQVRQLTGVSVDEIAGIDAPQERARKSFELLDEATAKRTALSDACDTEILGQRLVTVLTMVARTIKVCPSEGAPKNVFGPRYVCIEGTEARRVLVTPSEPPSTRTRVAFDSLVGTHVEAEWNPSISARVVQSVVLEPGVWQVSFWSDPLRFAERPEANYAWSFAGAFIEAGGEGVAYLSRRSNGEGKVGLVGLLEPGADGRQHVAVALRQLPRLSVTEVARSFSERQGGAVGGRIESVNRSFVPEAVAEESAEFVRILGEIVVERAHEAGFELIRKRLQAKVCGVSLRDPELASRRHDAHGALFARTCRLLGQARLRDLTGDPKVLFDAVKADLLEVGLVMATRPLGTKGVDGLQRALMTAATRAVADHFASGATNQMEPSLLVSRVSSFLSDWEPQIERQKKIKPVLELALAVASVCHADGCDSRTIRAMLDHPEHYFAPSGQGQQWEDVVEDLHESWPLVDHWIARVLDVLRPPKGTDDTDRLRAAVDVVFEFLEKVDGRPRTTGGDKRVLRDLYVAAIDDDVAGSLLHFTALLERFDRDEQVAGVGDAARWVRGLASFAERYPARSGDTEETQEERRKARQEAVESLLAEATSRTERAGEVIYSVEGALGLRLGNVVPAGEQTYRLVEYPLYLPLGLAISRVYEAQWQAFARLEVFDLGRFVRYEKADSSSADGPAQVVEFALADAFFPALSIGASGTDVPLYGAVTLGYSPYFDNVQLFGSIGVEVPLWDLN